MVADILDAPADARLIAEVRERVKGLVARFPVYG
jgi:glycine hydroxymethyltransferase